MFCAPAAEEPAHTRSQQRSRLKRALQDAARLAISGKRLARARRELTRAYGADGSRLRALQPGSATESATLLRLCVLEGVLARYARGEAAARAAARGADGLMARLQVLLLSLAKVPEGLCVCV
jgi:hypothetical protein